ncbi:KTSC domain-containing protein [Scytonema sp. UIC 10036]|uniref:KTSC domain-containing protein n=1 Tax=Scytonema sp. UIC 10036 TaxID=2304196 RepID=UPI0012DA12B6|nr:KTSC domain-containing protein [Scytonema sp. UIC 10036]MUG93853.1 KTSC domain-containing protein [Scytonema sp. UIC 10036]
MKLSKIDLSNLVAIAHSDEYLQLLIDRGDEYECVAIPAPIQAYEGLQQLNAIVADSPALPSSSESIEMLPVSSSMADAVGYDPEEQVLQVEFHNGAVYQYYGVEADTWEELHEADSIGRFFNENIRGRYSSERIDDAYYTDDCCC